MPTAAEQPPSRKLEVKIPYPMNRVVSDVEEALGARASVTASPRT
jgi:hypothetical protein